MCYSTRRSKTGNKSFVGRMFRTVFRNRKIFFFSPTTELIISLEGTKTKRTVEHNNNTYIVDVCQS